MFEPTSKQYTLVCRRFEADIMIIMVLHGRAIERPYKEVTTLQTQVRRCYPSTTVPTQQSDETALVMVILIDTRLENYPMLYRRQTVDGEGKWH